MRGLYRVNRANHILQQPKINYIYIPGRTTTSLTIAGTRTQRSPWTMEPALLRAPSIPGMTTFELRSADMGEITRIRFLSTKKNNRTRT